MTADFSLSPQERKVLNNLPSAYEWWCYSDHTEPRWLLRPLIAKGEVTLLKGPPKDAGKTTFMLHAIKGMLRGEQFLGQTVGPLSVVYVSEETETFRMAVRRVGIGEDDSGFRPVDRNMVRGVAWEQLLRVLTPLCWQNKVELVVVDTFPHFAGMKEGEEHDAGVVTGRMKALQELADNTGAAVVAVCHDRKPGGGGSHLTKARGSNALVASVDRIVSLDRVRGASNVRVLKVTGRVSGQHRLLVELTPNGYVLVEGAADKGATNAPGTAQGNQGGKRSTKARLTLPTDEARAVSVKELMRKHNRKDSSVRRDLKRMAGLRTIFGTGKGDPHRYYVDGAQ